MDPIRYVDFLNGKYQSLGFPAYHGVSSSISTCPAALSGTRSFDSAGRVM